MEIIKTHQSYISKLFFKKLLIIITVFTSLTFILNILEEVKFFNELDLNIYYPFVFTSIKHNKRVRDVLSTALEINNNRSQKIKTHDLNLWLNEVIKANPPASVKGKNIKIKFVTQIRTCPPLFIFYTNHPKLISISYKRYLENQIRIKFGFLGVSIKISFRSK